MDLTGGYFDAQAHPAAGRGLSGVDDSMSGLFSKIFKPLTQIAPIAGAALAPVTGGASLAAAGVIGQVGTALYGAKPPAQVVVPPPPPPKPPPQPPKPAMPAWLPIALGVGAIVLLGGRR